MLENVSVCHFFLLPSDIPWYVYIDEHWGYFHSLTVVNNTAMNISAQIAVQAPAFDSFGYIPTSEISGSFYV